MRRSLLWLSLILLGLALAFSGCKAAAEPGGPTPEPQVTTTPTETPPPTPTTPVALAVLLAPQDLDAAVTQSYQELLQELAAGSGMELETRQDLQPDDIGAGWQVVVMPRPPANLAGLIAAAPQVQFVTPADGDLPAAANLTVIHTSPANAGFTAGYLMAVSTFDWRSGALLPSDAAGVVDFADGFRNGAAYYCGTCATYYSPYARFPLISPAPSTAGPEDWIAAMDALAPYVVYSVYVAPQAASPEVLSNLFNRELILAGAQTPPDDVRSRWAATIQADVPGALREIWPTLAGGQGAGTVTAPIAINDVQPYILTPGRLGMVQRMLDNLQAGLINPLSVPME